MNGTNFTFYSLVWQTVAYVSNFTTTPKFDYFDIGKTSNTEYNKVFYYFPYYYYTYTCPSNSKVLSCDCSCDQSIIGLNSLNTNYCKCYTPYKMNCRLGLNCIDTFSNASIDIVSILYYKSNITSESTCPRPYNQLISSCSFFIFTASLNYTLNLSNSTHHRLDNYLNTSYGITLNGQGQVSNLSDSSGRFFQKCSIPSESIIIFNSKSYFMYYSRMYIKCISVKCSPIQSTTNLSVSYSYLALNEDIIWGSMAILNSSNCILEESVLECGSNGTWNNSFPFGTCKNLNGNWTDWIIKDCYLNYKKYGINISLNSSDCFLIKKKNLIFQKKRV